MTHEDMAQRRDGLIRQHAGDAGLRGKIDAKCIECLYDYEQSP